MPVDLVALDRHPIGRDLGIELATQLVICLNGLMDERALHAALLNYFDRCAASTTLQTPSGKQYNNVDKVFDYLATYLLRLPRPAGPLGLFEYALDQLYEWQAIHPSVHVHKATAYYWAGLRDIELGNIERGLLYMHQSVKEDEVTHESPRPATPATWFITMDPTHPEQAYHARVQHYSTIVDGYLADYRASGLGALTIADLRTRLQRPMMLDAAIGLLHVVAQLDVMADPSTSRVRQHEFAALAYSRLVLEICLVFEDRLAPLVPAKVKTLGAMLLHYRVPGAIHFTKKDRDQASAAFNADLDADLAASVSSLLDSGSLPPVRSLQPQERDVLLLYGVRNASAHRLGRSSVFALRFEDLVRHLLFAVFYLIEEKYP